MYFQQFVKECHDALMRVINRLKPQAQLGQKRRNKSHQAGTVFARHLRLGTPDQIINQSTVTARVDLLAPAIDHCFGYYLAPNAR